MNILRKCPFFFILAISIFPALVFSQGTWVQKANFGGTARYAAVGFSIGTKGYIGTGGSGSAGSTTFENDFWEWDEATGTWTQKADCGFIGRAGAVGFSIGNKGYIGTGTENGKTDLNDFWEWDQVTNTWTQKANLGGVARGIAVGFSIGNKGYIGTGFDKATADHLDDFWEWDQATNTWTQRSNLPGGIRLGAFGFAIGTKGYIGSGHAGTFYNDFWEFDPATNLWTQKANFIGNGRVSASEFSIGTKGYIGGGANYGTWYKDLWEWDQGTNAWTKKADFGGPVRDWAVGFSIECYGYIGTGFAKDINKNFLCNDFWEFYDQDNISCSTFSVVTNYINALCKETCDGSASVTSFNGNSPVTYLWSNGQTLQQITGLCPGTYLVKVTDATGITVQTAVTVNYDYAITADAGNNVSINSGKSVLLSATGGTTYSWYPTKGLSDSTADDPTATPDTTTTYYVLVKDANGCSALDSVTVTVILDFKIPCQDLYLPNAFSPDGDGKNDTLFVRGTCIKTMSLVVYDRWGEVVFETIDPLKGWDGKVEQNSFSPAIFTYHLHAELNKGDIINERGNIMVLR